mmetsp:Transcript_13761/g.24699  ORF Transcript_13761/g.24699 Transcript_13761/m.24699 type:complete len:209 (-) Transcript_13761:8-634(-)
MGGDGGTLNTSRNEQQRMRRGLFSSGVNSKEEQEIQAASERWQTCALSKSNLQNPVVMCGKGNLYNKTAVLEYLLDPETHSLPEISSLRSVIPVHLHDLDETSGIWRCPITLHVANGSRRFLVNRGCGCVLSLAAIEQLLSHTGSSEKRSIESRDTCEVCQRLLETTLPSWELFPEPEIQTQQFKSFQELIQKSKSKKRKKVHSETEP